MDDVRLPIQLNHEESGRLCQLLFAPVLLWSTTA
jgi:hypothetical protein